MKIFLSWNQRGDPFLNIENCPKEKETERKETSEKDTESIDSEEIFDRKNRLTELDIEMTPEITEAEAIMYDDTEKNIQETKSSVKNALALGAKKYSLLNLILKEIRDQKSPKKTRETKEKDKLMEKVAEAYRSITGEY